MDNRRELWGRRLLAAFSILLVSYLCCKWQRVFYHVCIGDIFSDVPAHVKLALSGADYGLASLLIHILYGTGNEPFAQTVLSVCMTGSNVLLLFSLYRLVRELIPELDGWSAFLGCTLALLCGPWIIPGYQTEIYLGALNGNLYHNMTVLFSRAFVPGSLKYFLRCRSCLSGKIELRDWLGLTLCLFVCTAFKPNYAFAYIPVLAVLLIYELIKRRGENFRNLFILGCSALPAGITCIWQYLVLFDSDFAGTSSQMAVKTYALPALLALAVMYLRSLLLPVYTDILCLPGDKKRRDIGMINVIFFVSLLEASFLTETGYRATDGNFDWGALAIYPVIFAIAIAMLFRMAGEKKGNIWHFLKVLAGMGILFGHLVIGGYFLYYFSTGASYFI